MHNEYPREDLTRTIEFRYSKPENKLSRFLAGCRHSRHKLYRRGTLIRAAIIEIISASDTGTMHAHLIRPLEPGDYELVAPIVDQWWGGRPVRALLPRLFFEHFNPTSFIIGAPGVVTAFLIGLRSQSQPGVAYIHFVGVDPALRNCGLGRLLYERFFQVVGTIGCTEVQCITSPVNTGSIAFHRKMGFELSPGSGEVGGIPVTLNFAGEGQHRVRFRKCLRLAAPK